MMYVNGQAVAPTNTVKEMHEYSTTEQVVGTWIDGKPLYEKTVFVENITFGVESGEPTPLCEFATNENIKLFDSIFFANNGTRLLMNGSRVANAQGNYYAVYCNTDSHTFYAYGNWGSNRTGDAILIYRYTKTTD